MTVKEMFLNDQYITVSGDGYDREGGFYLKDQQLSQDYPNLESMLHYGSLCNHASLQVKKGKYIVDGDPTDGALLVAARKIGLMHQNNANYKMIKEIPFDSERKRMSVVIEDENNMRFLITKGAPEILLPRSSYILNKEGRKVLKNKNNIDEAINQMANQSLRTIAICMRPLSKNETLQSVLLERDLTFIGLFGMIDPPRQIGRAHV